jgi:putative transposase
VLKYDILRLPPEVQAKIPELLKIQEEFRRWASEWARSNGKVPMPEENPLRYLAREFVHAYSALDWLRARVVKRTMQTPLILDAQLRLSNERDQGRGIFVDAPRRELRVRKLGIGTLALPLSKSDIEWILKRIHEGARLVLAMVWVGGDKLYIALVFRRDITPIETKRLLAIDLNALHNGVAYAIVERNRVLERSALRPHLRKLEKLWREASMLDSLCAKKGGTYCEKARAASSRLWRLLRGWQKETARFIVKLALQYRAAIVVDVPENETIQELKEDNRYPAERKAPLNFGKLRKLIEKLAKWHGIPYIETRLYSTVCPRCGTKMKALQGRRVKCVQCGLEVGRDEVPIMWAMKRFDKLLDAAKSQSLSFSPPGTLINPAVLPPHKDRPPRCYPAVSQAVLMR